MRTMCGARSSGVFSVSGSSPGIAAGAIAAGDDNNPQTLLSQQLEQAFRSRAEDTGFIEPVSTTDALTGGMNWYRAMPFGIGGARGDTTVPTTFIWGARDSFLTRTGAIETAAHVLGRYRFEVVEDGGHWLPETHPALVAELVADRIDSIR